ncbi:hypothetical protein Tco_0283403, partial [Tanacetum coccineum]
LYLLVVIVPAGSVITAGSVIVPAGSVIVPAGSVITAGSVIVPAGSVITAGSVIVPAGSVITAGSVIVPFLCLFFMCNCSSVLVPNHSLSFSNINHQSSCDFPFQPRWDITTREHSILLPVLLVTWNFTLFVYSYLLVHNKG